MFVLDSKTYSLLCFRSDDLFDLQSVNTESIRPPTLPQSSPQPPLPPKDAPTTTSPPGSMPTRPKHTQETTIVPQQKLPSSTTLTADISTCPTKIDSRATLSCQQNPSPSVDVVHAPTPTPESPENNPQTTSLIIPLTVQATSQPPLSPTHRPSQSPTTIYQNITQNSSTLPDVTQSATQSLSGAPTESQNPSRTPPNLNQITNNTPAPRLAKAPPTPPLSPPDPDPFLLTSVTFTSSVPSHLYSPLCSSSASLLCSLDSLGPCVGLPPVMSSAPTHLATPPPILSPPCAEVTLPPAQLLGSDDEEQEDPSDYCKGECSGGGAGLLVGPKSPSLNTSPCCHQVVTTQ